MPKIDLYNSKKEVVGNVELPPSVFDVEIKEHLFYDVVRMQLANKRKGTASTKERAEVRGGGKKPWRQKGTGRARAGSTRSPIWVGGGTIFGPKPRDYSFSVPKKVKKIALKSALTKKVREGKLIIVDSFGIPEAKTKVFLEIMKGLNLQSALFVTDDYNRNLDLASRNIHGVKVLLARGLNVFDVLKYDAVVVNRPAIDLIEKALS